MPVPRRIVSVEEVRRLEDAQIADDDIGLRLGGDEAAVRPLITTVAPAPAKPLAIAKPMPSVEPVTIAVLPERSMFICCLESGC
jgi:hypothetical protein